ncbi:SET domain-containing protein 4, partial [Cricetulus griseus]
RHAGGQSLWKSYLDILPKSYTCPVCLEPDVVDLLPQPLKAKAEEQRADVQDFFASSRAFFSTLQPLFVEPVDGIFSYSAFLWAWCTVNTRAVYLRSTRQECLSAEPDTCALAPYLDLLNHSPHVQYSGSQSEEHKRVFRAHSFPCLLHTLSLCMDSFLDAMALADDVEEAVRSSGFVSAVS